MERETKLVRLLGKHFLELAKQRKTAYEFSEKNLTEHQLQRVLEAGQWAPSSHNMQPWHFIVVKNPHSVERLVDASFYGAFHTNPPVVIAVVLRGDIQSKRIQKFGKMGKSRDIQDTVAIGACAMQMCLEAEDQGIGTCILTPQEEKVKTLLRVKKGDELPIMIGFGFEKKKAFQKKRVRKPLESMVSKEHFEAR